MISVGAEIFFFFLSFILKHEEQNITRGKERADYERASPLGPAIILTGQYPAHL